MAFKKKKITYEYSSNDIKNSVMLNARSINLPEGWAKQIATRVAKSVDEWIADKEIVTEGDLRKKIVSELKDLNPDLAYAYQNHDKII